MWAAAHAATDREVAVPAARPATRTTRAARDARRTYVLDTSVLLSDPLALLRFDEHEVVLPVVVVTELEGKRAHPELGYFAREALRLLDDLRVQHGRLDEPLDVGEHGGTLHVLPAGFRLGDNDSRILAVARSLSAAGRDVVLVSKDLPMRVKASAMGLAAEEYRAELAVESGWTGMTEVDVAPSTIDALFADDVIDLPEAMDLPCHTGLVLLGGTSSALARVTADKRVRLVRGDRDVFGLHGRSAEQRVAVDILLDPDIGIVSLGGRAGTGKSALALCAGLEAVLERRQHRKVVVFRPLYAVGGQDLGYLPGSEAEKMGPWGQAVFDTLSAVTTQEVVEEVVDRGMLEVLPLTHIRGRSLHDAFVVVDFTSRTHSVRHVRRKSISGLSRTRPFTSVRDTVGPQRLLAIDRRRVQSTSTRETLNGTRSRPTGRRCTAVLRAGNQPSGLC
jgi:PhoH-like ATPase